MLTNTFYDNGSRKTLGTPAGNFTNTYDALGRPTGLTNYNGEAFAWSYDDADRLIGQTSPLTQTTRTLNALGDLTGLTNQFVNGSTTQTFGTYTAGYDGALNLKSVTASIPLYSTQSGTTNYTYDSKSQLTQESSTRLGNYSNSHAYDTAGNPTTLRNSSGLIYNANNQRTGSGYTYDGNGNPTTYKGSSLTFDAENRLKSIGSNWSATYRPDGLRASKTYSGTSSNVATAGTTYFVYDGSVPVLEVDGSGNLSAVNTFGVTGLLGRHIFSYTYSWFHVFDVTGNAASFARGNGSLADDYYAFDGFGSRSAKGNYTASDPFIGYGGQAGYYTDWETGLTLCGHRYYDSANARWLTRDPIGYMGGINLYEYASNAAPNALDATGFKAYWVTVPFDGALSPLNKLGIGYSHAYLRLDQPCSPGDPPGPDGCWSYGFWTKGADWQLPSAQGSAGSAVAGSGSSSLGSSSSGSGYVGVGSSSSSAGGSSSVPGSSAAVGFLIGIPGEIRSPDPRSGEGNADFVDGSDDSKFMSLLCSCIRDSQAHPPKYKYKSVCGSWVGNMIDCAKNRVW